MCEGATVSFQGEIFAGNFMKGWRISIFDGIGWKKGGIYN